MKIGSSTVLLASAHTSVQSREQTTSLRAWRSSPGSTDADPSARSGLSARGDYAKDLRPNSRRHVDVPAQANAGESKQVDDSDENDALDPRTRLLKLMVERMTGQKIHLLSGRELKSRIEHAPTTAGRSPAAPASVANQSVGFGAELRYHESVQESETTVFAAKGTVVTTDGKAISFKLDIAMQREYASETDVRALFGDAARRATDPLVVNFDGNAAGLTGGRFEFDLDADGSEESLSKLGAGSAFLWLDQNGNGAVDDGSELFGTRSGDGFADLAAYDADSNGWIDEADPVYDQLGLWMQSETGQGAVATLRQKDIGAIYLGSAATSFDLKDAANGLQGIVRRTGVYLSESGAAGSVQQVDLVPENLPSGPPVPAAAAAESAEVQ